MIPVLEVVGIIAVVFVIVLAAIVVLMFSRRKAIIDGFEMAGVRVVKDGFVSLCVLQIDERELALIDTGNDRSGKAILAELSRRGLGVSDVKAILHTHGHRDHTASNHLFQSAQVMALAAEVDLVEGRAAGHGPLTRFIPMKSTGITVTRTLQDGEMVEVGKLAVRVYAVPGHTGGSAAFLVGGVLVLGDSADATRDNRLTRAPWLFSDDAAQNRASLIQLKERLMREGIEVKALVFSHSGALAHGLVPLEEFTQSN